MEQIRQACDVAQRLTVALDDAIVNARELGAPMARLEAQTLFAAATRRNEVNATVAGLVAELGEVVRGIAGALGWKELTLARLKTEEPEEASELEGLLAEIRKRAAALQKLDETNRVRGNRALAWMRILIAGHTGQPQTAAYDKRGSSLTTGPTLRTASRTL